MAESTKPLASVALSVAFSVVCGVVLAQSGDSKAPPAQSTFERKPFTHRAHVPSVWYYRGAQTRGGSTESAADFDKFEVARDCRGCHDFGARDASGALVRPPRSPLATCTGCHFNDVLAPEAMPGFELGLREGRGSTSAFEHLDHDALACRACHASTSKEEEIDLPGRTGVPACIECHTKGGEDIEHEGLAGARIKTSNVRTGFLAWLNTDPSMSRPGRGPYPHDKHLTPAELTDPAACATCHADVFEARADELASKEYSEPACATCHVQSDATPVAIGRAVESRTSLAALTFSHADHLGENRKRDRTSATPEAFAALDAEGCLACHVHSDAPPRAPDGTARAATFVVRDDRAGYEGCMSCHGVPRFQAPNHGEWSACTVCHELGSGDLAASRRSSPVERALPGAVRFLMPAQEHPGLGPDTDQDCADCHRGMLPSKPSRIVGVRFEHASHLPPAPTAEHCQSCHPGIAGAVGSTAIGRAFDETRTEPLPPEEQVTFDPASCQTCHPGIALDPASLASRSLREVVAFDHEAHLRSAHDPRIGEPVTCISCHEFVPGDRGKPLGIRESASTCVACHKHDETHAEWTGKIYGDAVESCAVCHAAGEPKVEQRLPVERVSVALQGAQHHPADRACADCHLELPAGRLAPVTAVTAVLLKPDPNPHNGPDGFYPVNRSCVDCHWAVRLNSLREADRPTSASRAASGASLSHFSPEDPPR